MLGRNFLLKNRLSDYKFLKHNKKKMGTNEKQKFGQQIIQTNTLKP